jgi:exonuclease III
MITKKDFMAYYKVQKSGKYNMLSEQAQKASGLSDEKYIEIIKHYKEYREKYTNFKYDN